MSNVMWSAIKPLQSAGLHLVEVKQYELHQLMGRTWHPLSWSVSSGKPIPQISQSQNAWPLSPNSTFWHSGYRIELGHLHPTALLWLKILLGHFHPTLDYSANHTWPLSPNRPILLAKWQMCILECHVSPKVLFSTQICSWPLSSTDPSLCSPGSNLVNIAKISLLQNFVYSIPDQHCFSELQLMSQN